MDAVVPIKQNKTHLKWMRKYVGEDVPLFSIIVFSERCELKKITVESEDVKVIKRDRVYATVRDIWDAHDDVLSDEKVEELYISLKNVSNVDKKVKEKHIDNINKRLEERETADKKICPRCGSELVLRTAKSGAHAGEQFYGCSSFPKCRYILNIVECE